MIPVLSGRYNHIYSGDSRVVRRHPINFTLGTEVARIGYNRVAQIWVGLTNEAGETPVMVNAINIE